VLVAAALLKVLERVNNKVTAALLVHCNVRRRSKTTVQIRRRPVDEILFVSFASNGSMVWRAPSREEVIGARISAHEERSVTVAALKTRQRFHW
jgi:hypothetical protein